jgi:hypothetical protein
LPLGISEKIDLIATVHTNKVAGAHTYGSDELGEIDIFFK